MDRAPILATTAKSIEGFMGVSGTLQPDLCVVGAAPAALDAAMAAAGLGASVVLVLMDGPANSDLAAGALIKAGEHAQATRDAFRTGFPAAAAQPDFQTLMRSVENTAMALAANSAPERFIAMGITVIRGQGAFVDRRCFMVEGWTIRPRRFIIAAPKVPVLPEIPGLADLRVQTADTITTLDRWPERLIVIGGDTEGLALAQAFRRLGVEVVVIIPTALFDGCDIELAGVLRRTLRADGVILHENSVVTFAERKLDGISLTLTGPTGDRRLDGSHILVASGRRADIEPLNLAGALIECNDDGIVIDDNLRTTNSRIFSIEADSGHEAGLAVQNALLRAGRSIRKIHIPHSVRTKPEMSWVGLSEDQARSRHGKIEVLRWPFSENRRAQADDTATGFVKIITTRKGTMLGAAIAGPQAGELTALWAMAISRGMSIQNMSQLAMPPFSLSETVGQVALGYFSRRLTSLPLAIALKFNRWLG